MSWGKKFLYKSWGKNTSLKSCEVKNISHNRWGKILHISREVKNISHNWWGKITSHKSWGNNFSIQLTMCEVIFPHQSCEIFLAHTTWVRYFYLVTYMRNFTSRLVWGIFSTFLCTIKILMSQYLTKCEVKFFHTNNKIKVPHRSHEVKKQ